MAWNEWVLLGIGIAINIAGFIYNVWLMTHSSSRRNAWQEGFNEGLEQGAMAERSKQRVWADEEQKVIKIEGCFEIPKDMDLEDFNDAFISWVESQGCFFGGGMTEETNDE